MTENVIGTETIDVAPLTPPNRGGLLNQSEISNSTASSVLIFNAVLFESVEGGVQPSFKCPVCQRLWKPILLFGNATLDDYDFNDLINIAVPAHGECSFSGATISLFLAVHRDTNGIKICFQKSTEEGASGISIDWWRK
jgi:hypothetical protein